MRILYLECGLPRCCVLCQPGLLQRSLCTVVGEDVPLSNEELHNASSEYAG